MIQNAVRLLTAAIVAGAFAQVLAGCAVANSPAPSRAATRVAKETATTPALLALSPFEGACFLANGKACFADSFPAEKGRPSWNATIAPDGQTVVAVKGQSLIVYDVDAHKWGFLSLPERGKITEIEYSPDGQNAGFAIACGQVCSDGTSKYRLAVVDLRAKRFVEGGGLFLHEKLEGFQFSSREIFLATYCESDCEVGALASELRLFDLAKQSVIQRIALADHISRLTLSANGQTLAFVATGLTGSRLGVLNIAANDGIRSFRAEEVKFTDGNDRRRFPAYISIDGRRVAYAVQASNYTGGERIAVAERNGEGGVQERILQGEGFAGVEAVGFDAKGDVIFTGIGPRGALGETVKTKLASVPGGQRSIFATIAYAAAEKDGSLVPRINEDYGRLDTGRLACASDCSKLVFVGADASHKDFFLFVAENGRVRKAIPLPDSTYHVQALSADGKRALLDGFVLDLGNVPGIVDITAGALLRLPVLEFDKAEAAAAKQMR